MSLLTSELGLGFVLQIVKEGEILSVVHAMPIKSLDFIRRIRCCNVLPAMEGV